MIRINLLPVREARRKASLRQQGVLLAAAFGVGCSVALVLHVSIATRIGSTESQIASTEDERRKLEATLGDVERFRQQKEEIQRKLSVIRELEASRTGPVRVMDEVATHIPERMWLTKLSLQDGTVEISGYGLDNESIADFMTDLERSPHIGRVELLESKLENKQGLKVNKFKIKAQEPSAMRLAEARKRKAQDEKAQRKGRKAGRRRRR